MYSLDLEVCSTKLVLEHDILLKELPYVERHPLCWLVRLTLEEVKWLSMWDGQNCLHCFAGVSVSSRSP